MTTSDSADSRPLYSTGCIQKRWFRFRWTATACLGPEAHFYPVAQASGWAWTERRAHDARNDWLASQGAEPFPWDVLFGR